jgi:hypothetical protein
MIAIIPSAAHHGYEFRMSETEPASGSTVAGTGEFERGGFHVIASVEVRVGVIHGVGFSLEDGAEPPGAEEVVAMLVDRPVSEALEVNAGPDCFGQEGPGVETREVLLEAFHRAVESCLDQQ